MLISLRSLGILSPAGIMDWAWNKTRQTEVPGWGGMCWRKTQQNIPSRIYGGWTVKNTFPETHQEKCSINYKETAFHPSTRRIFGRRDFYRKCARACSIMVLFPTVEGTRELCLQRQSEPKNLTGFLEQTLPCTFVFTVCVWGVIFLNVYILKYMTLKHIFDEKCMFHWLTFPFWTRQRVFRINNLTLSATNTLNTELEQILKYSSQYSWCVKMNALYSAVPSDCSVHIILHAVVGVGLTTSQANITLM